MSNSEKPYVIVVGVDYSAASDLALERAFELAGTHAQAEVHVVNVVQLYGAQALIDYPPDPRGFASISLTDATTRIEHYAERRWQAFLAERGEASGVGRFTRLASHLRLEAPAQEIAQIAADLEADLIVVGTHGRRGISRLLLGSVAEAVVRLAQCPVLVARPKALPEEGPKIEPACPRCVETRRASDGAEYWCEQHRSRHGQRHTYHQGDRVGDETEMPLTFHT
ncbi:MAG TPA: universal stress protein [Polyangiaceae bacterium]|jgi:nucleotide-binding universal stress UspA family protein|nr:universal stress protein [Polyangiaceae bacterium]